MTEPKAPYWEGPYTDPEKLDAETRAGDVSIDDVGSLRQRRYRDNYMPGGWTQQGRSPLTSRELLANGKRPAWVLRLAEGDTHE